MTDHMHVELCATCTEILRGKRPGLQPGPAATARRGAPAQPSGTGARQVALFASGLQPSDAPTAEVAAEAITAAVRRFGSQGCVGRMAQEFGDHPDAASERMRWIIQLTAHLPARPPMPTSADQASSGAQRIDASSDHHHHHERPNPVSVSAAIAPRWETRHDPDL